MKTSQLLFALFLLWLPAKMLAQYSITVEISDLRNSKGQVPFMLLDENKKEIKGIIGEIRDNKCQLILTNLKPGKYAFQYFHDENSNKSLDKNIVGIPKEGYGFSNNAKGNFGPPAFDKWLFEIKSNISVSCKPTYF